MSFWGLSQGVGTLAGTLVGGLLGATDWRRPFLLLTVRRPGRHGGLPVHLRRPAWAERAGAGRGARRRCRVRLPDQPGRPAPDPRPADQPLADPPGADRAGRVRLAGLAAGAVRRAGRGAGLLGGHRDRGGQRLRHPVPARRGASPSSVAWSATRCNGVPRGAGPWSRRSASSPPCRSTWCCSSCRCRIDVPDGAGAGAVIGAVLASVLTEPTVGLSLLAAVAGARADLGQLAELVRPDRRRQPAGAPGHRLQPRQPGQRGRPGGRQRAGRGGLPRRCGRPSRRR